MKKIFIVYGHYNDKSFNAAIRDTFIETVKTKSEPDTHIRSRNVAFRASGLRPLGRQYAFFDGTSGIDLAPKLTEISILSARA